VVECLLCKHKALSSNPSLNKKKSIKERKTLNYKYNACHIELFLCIHKNSYIDKYKIDILIGCFLVSFSCFFAVLEIKLGAL
jgi:hypothetical protein